MRRPPACLQGVRNSRTAPTLRFSTPIWRSTMNSLRHAFQFQTRIEVQPIPTDETTSHRPPPQRNRCHHSHRCLANQRHLPRRQQSCQTHLPGQNRRRHGRLLLLHLHASLHPLPRQVHRQTKSPITQSRSPSDLFSLHLHHAAHDDPMPGERAHVGVFTRRGRSRKT